VHFYYEHLSECCGEAKSISIQKLTLTPCTDAGFAFVSGVQYVIPIKGYGGTFSEHDYAILKRIPFILKENICKASERRNLFLLFSRRNVFALQLNMGSRNRKHVFVRMVSLEVTTKTCSSLISWNLAQNVHYRVYKSPLLHPILNHLSPLFPHLHLHLRSVLFGFIRLKLSTYFTSPPCVLHVPPYHFP
jgi:hypothetical protein